MTIPTLEWKPGFAKLEWEDKQVIMVMTRFSEESRRVYAYTCVGNTTSNSARHLHEGDLILTSTRDKGVLAKHLATIRTDIALVDWQTMIEQACVMVLRKHMAGEPIVRVGNLPTPERPRWQLWPMMPMGDCTLLFGEGGVGKSLFGIAAGLAIQTGWTGLKLAPHIGNVLCLDWETSDEVVNERIKAIKKGAGLEESTLYYRYCTQSLSRSLPQIYADIAEKAITFVIIDSAIAALGSETRDPATSASEMFNSLRAARVSSLVITHTSKEQMGHKTPYGSVFFYNRARSVWEMRKSQSPGEDTVNVALFHRKSNTSKLWHPLGYQIEFVGDDEIRFTSTEISQMPGLEAGLPLRQRILALLEDGPFSTKAIAEALGAPLTQVSVRLSELRKAGKIGRDEEDEWTLA